MLLPNYLVETEIQLVSKTGTQFKSLHRLQVGYLATDVYISATHAYFTPSISIVAVSNTFMQDDATCRWLVTFNWLTHQYSADLIAYSNTVIGARMLESKTFQTAKEEAISATAHLPGVTGVLTLPNELLNSAVSPRTFFPGSVVDLLCLQHCNRTKLDEIKKEEQRAREDELNQRLIILGGRISLLSLNAKNRSGILI